MDPSPTVMRPKVLLLWALVIAAGLPLGWMVSDYVPGPVGWSLWGVILLGAQWALIRALVSDTSWPVVVLANAGTIVAFEVVLRAEAGDLFAAVALIAVVPELAFLIGLLVIAFLAGRTGIVSWVSLGLGPPAERSQELQDGVSRVRVRVRTVVRLCLVYLGGALIGSAAACLVNATLAQALLANDAYLGHILVRAGYGLIVAWYVWSMARVLRRDSLWHGRVDAETEGADVSGA